MVKVQKGLISHRSTQGSARSAWALSHTSKKFLFKTRTSNNQEYFLIREVSYSSAFLTFATRESAGVSLWPDRHGMRLEDFRGQKTEMSNICGWLTRGKKWLSQPAVAKTGSEEGHNCAPEEPSTACRKPAILSHAS